jgi:hypothetical protein
VLLADDGPRVIDFGLAQADAFSRMTGTGVAVGTPAYMAPEQVRGRVSTASDVFALGHLALFAATGHNAFSQGHADALFYRLLNEPPDLDGCPGELRAIIAHCLAKNPADRPAVAEVAAFAAAAMRARRMHPADRDWLPPPVADSLAEYAASNAPLPAAFAEPSLPDPREAAPSASLRVLLRPAILAPAALLIAAGGVIGFVAGHSGASARAATPAATSPAPANSGIAVGGPTAGAGVVPLQTPDPPSTTPVAASSAIPGADGFVQAYAGDAFTMPGGGCKAASNPSDVVLPGSQPFVDTVNDGSDGDMEISCAKGPELTFSDPVARVSKSPGVSACYASVSNHPMVGPAGYRQLTPGTQLCLATFSSTTRRTWVMEVTLKSADKVTDDLSWTATVWYRDPSAG